jgi:hypothetical protein
MTCKHDNINKGTTIRGCKRLLYVVALGILASPPPAWASGDLTAWVAGRPGAPAVSDFLSWAVGNPGAIEVRWRPWFNPDRWSGSLPWDGHISQWQPAGSADLDGVSDEADPLFTAHLSVAQYHGALRIQVSAVPRGNKNQAYEVVLRSSFNPGAWQRQFFSSGKYIIKRADEFVALRYLTSADDASGPTEFAYDYPFGVLERPQGYLLWGAMDLGRFRWVTPNHVSQSVPCFTVIPKKVIAGSPADFDMTLRWFPKPTNRYRDVLRWYLRSVENSDPLTHDLLPWDGQFRARPLPGGNLTAFLGPLNDSLARRSSWLSSMQPLHVSGLWTWGWLPHTESYPTSGSWETRTNGATTAEALKAHIAWLEKEGIYTYLYFRGFLSANDAEYPNPPYQRWRAIDETGKPELWNYGTDSGMQADFGNEEFRQWYVGRIKDSIAVYNPFGVAWDMGWWATNPHVFSSADPRTDNVHAVTRVQADIWKWLVEVHPAKRVIANDSAGLPSELFADAVMIEHAASASILDFEAAKALGAQIVAFELAGDFYRKEDPSADVRPLIAAAQMRELSYGGGIAGDNQAGFPEINGFSALAMGGRPLLGSHDIEVEGGAQVEASAWVSDGRLLIAAYNEGAPTPVTLRISADGLRQSGLSNLNASSALVLGKDGHPLTGDNARTVNITGLEVKTTLGTGEALLYQSLTR